MAVRRIWQATAGSRSYTLRATKIPPPWPLFVPGTTEFLHQLYVPQATFGVLLPAA
jgi:hypothetical protein